MLDSRDPKDACDEDGLAVAELRLEYLGRKGPRFSWLFAGPEALESFAAEVGWQATVVHQESDGRYLASLARS